MLARWSSGRGESNLRTHGPKFRTFPSKVTRGLHPTPPSNPRVGTPASPKAVTYPEGLVDTQHPAVCEGMASSLAAAPSPCSCVCFCALPCSLPRFFCSSSTPPGLNPNGLNPNIRADARALSPPSPFTLSYALPTTNGAGEDTATALTRAAFAWNLLPEVPGGYECVRKTSCDRSALECRSKPSSITDLFQNFTSSGSQEYLHSELEGHLLGD
jgi:hypothetical protein